MAFDPVARGLGARAAGRFQSAGKLKVASSRLLGLPRINPRKVMSSPPTLTSGTSSSMVSPQFLSPAYTTGGVQVPRPASEFFSFTRGLPNPTTQFGTAPLFDNVTVTADPTYGQVSVGVAVVHEGQSIEFILGGNSTSFLLKVNDEYVSLTPTSVPSNNVSNYYKFDFGSSARRRIELVGYNTSFVGVHINPTDTLTAAPVRGPRCIIMGDSFTAAPHGYPLSFADAMGWDDVWASGVGGTGYLASNSGAATTFRARVQHDVIAYNPEVVGIVGGINDGSASASAVGAEAALLFAQLKSSLPNALIFAGLNGKGGVNLYNANFLAVKAAIKASAQAAGVVWLDLLELPIRDGVTPYSGAIVNNQTAGTTGATGFLVNFVPQPGATLELGSSATLERVQVKSVTQVAANVFRVFFDGTLQYAHPNGEAVTQVGGALWTGVGKAGSTTGYGNSDLYVSSDGVHPTDAGASAMGHTLADLFVNATAPN